MPEEHQSGAADKAREMREHEREARERDSSERGEPERGDRASDDRPDETVVPPGNIQAGNLTGS